MGDSKADQKEADKAEAERRGLTYKQVRHERRKRETDQLQDSEHGREVKRLRAYSHDGADDAAAAKRRTRSVDVQEEQQAALQAETALTVAEWRKEHGITVQGHGAERSTTAFADPYRQFAETPFHDQIQRGFARAGFAAPTPIQAQAWPIALQSKDMICVAKVCIVVLALCGAYSYEPLFRRSFSFHRLVSNAFISLIVHRPGRARLADSCSPPFTSSSNNKTATLVAAFANPNC